MASTTANKNIKPAAKTAASANSKSTTNGNGTSNKQLELVKPNGAALAVSNQDVSDLILASAGAGNEGIGREDMAIPRVAILQSGSPQVKKSEGAYVKGAEEGDFFDNVSGTVLAKGDKGFLFIPATYRRANLEWIPKDSGGGFVADHGRDDSILSQCQREDGGNAMLLPNGHEIVTTAEYVGTVLDLDYTNPRQVAISMAKTQLKKAKKLNTVITTLSVKAPNGQFINPAMCYSVFHVTSVPESNDRGSWMGWNFLRTGDTLSLPNGADLFRGSLKLKDAVSTGAVQVAAPADVAAADADPDKF